MNSVGYEKNRSFHLLKETCFSEEAIEDLLFGFGVKARKYIVEDNELLLRVDCSREG